MRYFHEISRFSTLWICKQYHILSVQKKQIPLAGKTIYLFFFFREIVDTFFFLLQIVFFLLCMCLFCTIACAVWETLTGQQFQVSNTKLSQK